MKKKKFPFYFSIMVKRAKKACKFKVELSNYRINYDNTIVNILANLYGHPIMSVKNNINDIKTSFDLKNEWFKFGNTIYLKDETNFALARELIEYNTIIKVGKVKLNERYYLLQKTKTNLPV